MTRLGQWLGLTSVLVVAALAGCSDDSKAGSSAKWYCDKSTVVSACSCTYENEDPHYTNPVDECTPAVGNGARCCKSGAGAAIPICTCNSAYDVGCPDSTSPIASCSDLPPP